MSNRFEVEAVLYRIYFDLVIIFEIQDYSQNRRDYLTEHRRQRGSRDSHLGAAEIAEYHDRVEYQIDHRAHALRDHRDHRLSGRLHEPLHYHLTEYAKGQRHYNREVCHTVLDDFSCVVLCHHERSCRKYAEQQKDNVAEHS